MKLFTLGYQNLNVELYVKSLVNAGVGIVLDVREHAWSQRPAFIKSNLRSSLLSAGIEYQHVKDAGNPSRNRKTARNATECLSRYRRHLKDHAGCLAELLTIIRNGSEAGRPACLTCYERESQNCHRSVLLEELLRLEPLITPLHLEPTIQTSTALKEPRHSLTANAFLAPAWLPFT